MNVPVQYDAAGDSSHRIASATSPGSLPRCIGIDGASLAIRSGSPPLAWMPVCTKPGRTAFTRMPCAATSVARPRVNVSIAPLLAA